MNMIKLDESEVSAQPRGRCQFGVHTRHRRNNRVCRRCGVDRLEHGLLREDGAALRQSDRCAGVLHVEPSELLRGGVERFSSDGSRSHVRASPRRPPRIGDPRRSQPVVRRRPAYVIAHTDLPPRLGLPRLVPSPSVRQSCAPFVRRARSFLPGEMLWLGHLPQVSLSSCRRSRRSRSVRKLPNTSTIRVRACTRARLLD